jgi:VanZ family protein
VISLSIPRWSQLSAVRRVLLIGIAIGCLFLFAKEPGPEQHRLWNGIWNSGHLFLFSGFGFLCGERCLQTRAWSRFAALLIAAAVVGWLIELLQLATGRDYSLLDVAADTGGMAIGLLIGGYATLRKPLALFAVVTALSAAYAASQLLPIARAAIDAVAAEQAFPELANFVDGFAPTLQRDRFGVLRSTYTVVDGALQVDLQPAQYTGFILDDFPNDWRGRHVLRFDIINAGAHQHITCRIHDAAHERRGWAFNDRYNGGFELVPGANQLQIDLDVARHAPKEREMDLGDIRNFGCFVIDLTQPQTWLLQSIRLE